MDARTIRTAVRERYGAVAKTAAEDVTSDACCGTDCCGGGSVAVEGNAAADGAAQGSATAGAAVTASGMATTVGYAPDDLADLPEGANLGLGCGNPTALADVRVGETVLDLGSGAAIDCFIASKRVGPSGRVIGVDMTPEMVERARANAATGGYGNVEFRLGEIEALPVPDRSVDVIISNCVLNLSARRSEAFAEAMRVLRPGGRIMISDLLSEQPTPEFLAASVDLLVGCLPVYQDEYLRQLTEAGFEEVGVAKADPYPEGLLLDDPRVIELVGGDEERQAAVERFAGSVRGSLIHAVKPGD